MSYLFLFIGGGFGAISRYGIAQLFPSKAGFPLATFIANILACIILGIIMQKSNDKNLSQNLFLLLATGYCGGFSTFSTFSYETFQLLQSNQVLLAFLYVLSSVIVCFLAIWMGMKIFA